MRTSTPKFIDRKPAFATRGGFVAGRPAGRPAGNYHSAHKHNKETLAAATRTLERLTATRGRDEVVT